MSRRVAGFRLKIEILGIDLVREAAMESLLELLTPPIKIIPAVPLNDEEFIAFSRASEPYRMEKNAQGEIIVMTPVGREGGRRELLLVVELERWAETDGRGEVDGPNTGWNLPDGSTLSPDGSLTAKERLVGFTPEQSERFLPLCPDFIAEVRSYSDSIAELKKKMEQWIANGAKLGWLIDPFEAMVYVYRPGQPPEELNRPEVMEGEVPIAGFRLEMERFWA